MYMACAFGHSRHRNSKVTENTYAPAGDFNDGAALVTMS
jgi:hypothetical protein